MDGLMLLLLNQGNVICKYQLSKFAYIFQFYLLSILKAEYNPVK